MKSQFKIISVVPALGGPIGVKNEKIKIKCKKVDGYYKKGID